MDPTVLIEARGGGAPAVGIARRRRRSPRVRRDPIEVQLVAAEAAESGQSLDADEILAALEAEVGRVATMRPVAEPARERVTAPTAVPTVESAPRRAPGPAVPPAPIVADPRNAAPACGISPDQVRAWMDQVQGDLRKVRARVEYLQLEQSRLEEQQRLMAQLITSSTPL